MDLRKYLSTLDVEGQARFAAACGTTRGHIRNVAYGYRPVSPEVAVAAERESGGALAVESLLPACWIRIPDKAWPHRLGRPALDLSATPQKAEA